MIKSLYKALFSVIGAFLIITCISCHSEEKSDLNIAKYNLVKFTYNNQEFNASEEYNYYYIFLDFKTNEITIVYNKKSNNVEKESVGSFIKNENMYVAIIDGTTLNFNILDKNTLECYMFYINCVFELER